MLCPCVVADCALLHRMGCSAQIGTARAICCYRAGRLAAVRAWLRAAARRLAPARAMLHDYGAGCAAALILCPTKH
ncbi:hypothetical protein CBM2615_A150016 [Cupriavidus taiwanensis]|uniref:Uncharacterized protein n=1 Tax=Cupriavidus taiwanensis TaxID=164546 RepID=A0A976ATY7_9BURK|nr:hypothetical protein CBM2615_A150016 [Cupriavidus taiwanensis]SOZ54173.1 hypothetical protein CBM2613_A150016 [Cupriavidus taiwanensis]SPA04260.1 hypothetical protein CBM2625_A110017 [Cupriavidus taiwanensis]